VGGQSSIYSRRLLTCFHSSIRPSIPAPSNAIPFPKPVINSAGLCSCCLPHPVSQSNGQPTFLREGFGKQMEARGGRGRRKERLAHSPCCRVFPRYFGSSFSLFSRSLLGPVHYFVCGGCRASLFAIISVFNQNWPCLHGLLATQTRRR